MTNNDVLRSLRYTLNTPNHGMIAIFALTNVTVTKEQVMAWLESDESESFAVISDELLAGFLNGVIIQRRGAKDGVIPAPETKLNYNIIMRKLKIAFDLKDDDILALLEGADFRLSKHELSAFFRRPDHKHYRACQEQVLRYFLRGISLKFRPVAS
uniref:Conserved domain protein n=1 Tax=Rheinheimera sp. BAL341 TaxID=1708203 RepID=A0A486XUG8_9GAMM